MCASVSIDTESGSRIREWWDGSEDGLEAKYLYTSILPDFHTPTTLASWYERGRPLEQHLARARAPAGAPYVRTHYRTASDIRR